MTMTRRITALAWRTAALARRTAVLARRTAVLARFGRRIADVIAECNYAQRRVAALRTTPDRYLAHGDEAPDNYAEFLFRTSGPLLHEPPATRRASGRLVG
jgi:hypothetical protein